MFTPVHTHEFAELAKQKIAEFNALHWDVSKRQQLGLKLENDKGELVAALAGRNFWSLVLSGVIMVRRKHAWKRYRIEVTGRS